MTSDFTGIPLVMGAARGVRAFEVDALGRLLGVSYPEIWTPGDNNSKCLRLTGPQTAVSAYHQMNRALARLTIASDPVQRLAKGGVVPVSFAGMAIESKPSVPEVAKKHAIAECTCGFYAYYDGNNEYATSSRVQAVVDGFGETTIGTRGFRAEKAKIVALCIPTVGAPATPQPPRLILWFHDHDWISPFAFVGGLFAAVGSGVGTLAGSTASLWSLFGIVPTVLLLILAQRAYASELGTKWGIASTYQRQRDYPSLYGTSRRTEGLAASLATKVRANYDVPVFDTYEAMVKAFPPDHGHVPTPDTDPDFWTRSI